MNRIPMTANGAERLRRQLEQLKSVERPQVIEAIAEARAHGDLSENAEYHAARERQGFIEGRIASIDEALATAEIIDVAKIDAGSKIVFGATVELFNLHSEQEVRYQIVGEKEADIDQGLLSVTAPIARAMIGKEQGDVIEVNAPGGIIEYEVLSVAYSG
ncbi:MAG: transcription elongation factor GreA [Gammaproteobacteria bacterium]|nr:transcription elongation factor GreA [Gammaproteobacteria bacterium]MCY4211110.1 transcription elongation factor GreA [Gammaproteobacteria bacterium]MCY4282160.1 transcription elongation factor GreA [Gammaproteobacteria bacterium]MCY4337493.1 transcription elongation factor GreA [Gammaproteobacteria bacterium]